MTTKPKKKPAKGRYDQGALGKVHGKRGAALISKPAKRARSAISGRYGGAKEVEALARRIIDVVFAKGGSVPVGFDSILSSVKAELLKATTVEEVVERVLWRGWAWTPPADFGLKGPPFLYNHPPHGPVDGVERVRLVVDEG